VNETGVLPDLAGRTARLTSAGRIRGALAVDLPVVASSQEQLADTLFEFEANDDADTALSPSGVAANPSAMMGGDTYRWVDDGRDAQLGSDRADFVAVGGSHGE
jgi:hypothetical protein